MPGKVFISCGQRHPDETTTAETIAGILRSEFGLTPYLSFKIQSLDDIMIVTKELSSSDYYLFVDFLRRPRNDQDLPLSLFTHQELALAYHLGFRKDVIALQEEGAKREGFLRYVLGNPESFKNKDELYDKIRTLVKSKKWNPRYSRNLIVQKVGFSELFRYTDHVGSYLEKVWRVRVSNRQPDDAARNSVCILDTIQNSQGQEITPFDRSYLKWAGQAGYERTILPNDFGDIDLFSIHADEPGIFLHSLRDTHREAIVKNDDDYTFSFKIFSQDFPLVGFSVKIHLRWQPIRVPEWGDNIKAELLVQ